MQDTATTTREPHKPFSVLLLVIVAILLIGSGCGIYSWQHNRLKTSQKQQTSLKTQLTSLQQQASRLQSARNISTSNWKTYCDYHGNFCFNYPSNWSFNSNYESDPGVSGLGMGSATLKNPGNTISASYLDDYIKDGTSASFVAHSVNQLSGAGKNLLVLGGYYVTSGGRTPEYIVVNSGTDPTSPMSTTKAGQTVLAPLGPVFQYNYGSDTALGQFTIQGKNYATAQEADAWFDSIDGQTALKVIDSFVSGSAYTGKYLSIPELGLRMKLTYNTQDAYYSVGNSGGKSFVALSTHSLDAYSGCSATKGNDGVAFIGTFTKGQTDPVYGNFSSDFPSAPLISGKYYYVGGNQYDCTLGEASALYSDVRHDFINAYSTIESTK